MTYSEQRQLAEDRDWQEWARKHWPHKRRIRAYRLKMLGRGNRRHPWRLPEEEC